jgi:hypothetical protein
LGARTGPEYTDEPPQGFHRHPSLWSRDDKSVLRSTRGSLSSEDLQAILDKTVLQISQDDFEGAWSTAAHLLGLDYRFFTKWLWVAGVDAGLQAPPLVLDSQVRLGLQKTKWPFHPRRINDCQLWVNYCIDAAAVGRELGVTGEWVEYWLFSGAPGAPCE